MKTSFLLTMLAVGLGWFGSARAQNYAIDWFTIDGGGGTSTGGGFALSGTIGQTDGGTLTGGPYALAGGFWSLVGASQSPQLLSIERVGNGLRVFWPLPAAGFVLDETVALASPPAAISWSQVPMATYQTNATHISITVTMPVGSKFYRLRKP